MKLFIYFGKKKNDVNHFRSFAYYTVQERLPIILTKIIDQTTRDKDELAEQFGGEVNAISN